MDYKTIFFLQFLMDCITFILVVFLALPSLFSLFHTRFVWLRGKSGRASLICHSPGLPWLLTPYDGFEPRNKSITPPSRRRSSCP